MEAHYFAHREASTPGQVRIWRREMRPPDLLIEIAQSHPVVGCRLNKKCPLLAEPASSATLDLERALQAEESAEREKDRRYWLPLRAALENLPLSRQKLPKTPERGK